MTWLTLLMLAVLEVSLSFDNAVVNALVLRGMPEIWRRRFLTWGLAVAVFGMRLGLPLLIVMLTTGLGAGEVLAMALHDAAAYQSHLQDAHLAIAAFGGTFLMLVFFGFLFDPEKEVHWLRPIERPMAALGKAESFVLILAVAVMLTLAGHLPPAEQMGFLIPAWMAVQVFFFLEWFFVSDETVGIGWLSRFLYLEVIDASFSLDGVVGAFVLTQNLFLIMAGLGLGALAIRSLTLHAVRMGALDELIYLEHGAHWGIGFLAAVMLASIFVAVPEPVTGLSGIAFIGAALVSSLRHKRKEASCRKK